MDSDAVFSGKSGRACVQQLLNDAPVPA